MFVVGLGIDTKAFFSSVTSIIVVPTSIKLLVGLPPFDVLLF